MAKEIIVRFAPLILVAAALIIALLVLLPGSGNESGDIPVLFGEKIKHIGEVIEQSDTKPQDDRAIPFSREDSIDTLQKAARAMQEQSEQIQGKKIEVADKETLASILPEIDDWQLASSEYHKGAYGIAETANLSSRYTGAGSREVFLEIIDYGTAAAALQPLKMIFSMNNSTDDYKRYAKVSNYNGIAVFEEYDKRTRQAEFSFIVRDRYIVNLKCEGKGSQEILKRFMPRFDFSKLE